MRRGGSFIRAEIIRLLKEYGHYVYAVIADRKRRCSCYDTSMHESKLDCPRCFGLGYEADVYRLLTRDRGQTPPSWGYFGATQLESPGVVEAGGRYFYFVDDVWMRSCPSGGDLILEAITDAQGKTTGLSAVYVVGSVEAYRGEQGQIAYYRVACHLDSTSLAERERALVSRLTGMMHRNG